MNMRRLVPPGVKFSKSAYQYNTKTLEPIFKCLQNHFNMDAFINCWGVKFGHARFHEKCRGDGPACPKK